MPKLGTEPNINISLTKEGKARRVLAGDERSFQDQAQQQQLINRRQSLEPYTYITRRGDHVTEQGVAYPTTRTRSRD
jgi:hypothetical protein